MPVSLVARSTSRRRDRTYDYACDLRNLSFTSPKPRFVRGFSSSVLMRENRYPYCDGGTYEGRPVREWMKPDRW